MAVSQSVNQETLRDVPEEVGSSRSGKFLKP